MQQLEAFTNPVSKPKTGLANWDNAIGDLLPGHLYVLMSMPACGKTAFCLNIAVHNCAAPIELPVLYINPAVATIQIINRLIACASGISYRHVWDNEFSAQDWGHIRDSLDFLVDIEQRFNHIGSTQCSISNLEETLSSLDANNKPGLIIIDDADLRYLGVQLPVDELLDFSELKQLAKKFNVPILFAANIELTDNNDDITIIQRAHQQYDTLFEADCILALHQPDNDPFEPEESDAELGRKLVAEVLFTKLGYETEVDVVFYPELQQFQ